MELVINNHVIDADVEDILKEIRRITDGRYCNQVIRRGENVGITCPFHKNGQESHPSCYVYNRIENESVPFGFFKCFTCGEQGTLDKLVSYCLNITVEDAKQWLIDNFSNTFRELKLNLPEIEIGKRQEVNYLDESVLDQYKYIHPYILSRGVSEEIVKKFSIGWNEKNDSITFPVWDEHNHLLGITERQIKKKAFHIPDNIKKPIYLLNFIIKENIQEVYVVESQIDALYMWSIGYPTIALLGTGAKSQYEILKKSGVRVFHLALDGDFAGRSGEIKFINNMPDSVMIDVLLVPDNKDINDLSPQEIYNLERCDKLEFTKKVFPKLHTKI